MKGQGLSITTIVVAAIALLILVVLVAVFTGQFGKFSQGVSSCDSRGGTPTPVNAGSTAKITCNPDIALPGNWGKDQACCISPDFNKP